MSTALERFRKDRDVIEHFCNTIVTSLSNPSLTKGDFPFIHSIKSRLKNEGHLIDKIQRIKAKKEIDVEYDNLYDEINDLAGVRILHLSHDQFPKIHDFIVNCPDWSVVDNPKAMSWDPEMKNFYENLDITIELRDTFYTSVHYIVKPNNDSEFTCEIQVRTLFEEVWGELDHSINYPHKTQSMHCKEQLMVLSKLVGTGSRLVSSIMNAKKEFEDRSR